MWVRVRFRKAKPHLSASFGVRIINYSYTLIPWKGELRSPRTRIRNKNKTYGLMIISGDPGASRTHNLLLRTELLYPLSYWANVYILAHLRANYYLRGSGVLSAQLFSASIYYHPRVAFRLANNANGTSNKKDIPPNEMSCMPDN